MMYRIWALIRKEVLHIRRDGRSLLIVFLMPLLMILLYGYAISFDIKEIGLGLYDADRTPASRALSGGSGDGLFFSAPQRQKFLHLRKK